MATDKEIVAAGREIYVWDQSGLDCMSWGAVDEQVRVAYKLAAKAALTAAEHARASEPRVEIEAATIERCALAVRDACGMCNEGVADVIDGAPVECEYCGRPMAAIRALTAAEQVRESE
jgi:hypothetical protein